MSSLEDGYSFVKRNAGALNASLEAAEYVSELEKEIDSFVKKINDAGLQNKNAPIDNFQGFVAEYWHAYTFNLQAKAADSSSRASVLETVRSQLASVDVVVKDGTLQYDFGLKYYKNSIRSARAQSQSILDRYMEYRQDKANPKTIEEYLAGTPFADKNVHSPLYEGQIRIIPAEQLEQTKEILRRAYLKESYNRPELALKYKDTLDNIDAVIRDGHGIKSLELSRQDSANLARAAQEEKVDAKCLREYGVSLDQAIKNEYIFKHAFKAGTTAAVISVVLKTAPEILKAISFLIKNGYVSQEHFKKVGFAALDGSATGFLRGAVAAGLTIGCKSGMFGTVMKSVSPSVIGALTVLAITTMKDAFEVALHRKSTSDLTVNLVRNMIVATSALVGGALVQAALLSFPAFGFMLGSFIGSVVGSFAYSFGGKAFLSFCVDTGFTMFGIVKQDYRLPSYVLESLGLDFFEYENFEYEEFEYEQFEYEQLEYEEFEYDQFEIQPLRRGIIGVRTIGYV